MGKLILNLCLCACLSVGVLGLDIVKAYDARVYDYTPAKDATVKEIIFNNVRNIVNEVVENQNVVVFPEYGITGTEVFSHNNLSEFAIKIPDVDPAANLCRGNGIDQVISDLACIDASLKHGTYLVVNLLELSGEDIYNTNIVLQKGAIVAKYRKINLNEKESRLKAGTDAVTFTTDFNITFGLITSDDVLHRNPAQDIFRDAKVTEVIMTSAWQSEVPFFTSAGLHDGYAKKNGINFMVSSISNPGNSQGGSGFYTPKGGAINYVPVVPGILPKKLKLEALTRRQPEKACDSHMEPRGLGAGSLPDIDSFKTLPMTNMNQYTFKKIVKSENNNVFQDEICKDKFCCKFSIDYSPTIFEIRPVYKVAVSDFACGLIACDSEDEYAKCGSRDAELARTSFNSIKIEARIEGKEKFQFLPVSSNRGLKSLHYKYCETSSELTVEAGFTDGLVYLGIVAPGGSGRGTGDAHHVVINIGLLGIVTLFMAMYNRFM